MRSPSRSRSHSTSATSAANSAARSAARSPEPKTAQLVAALVSSPGYGDTSSGGAEAYSHSTGSPSTGTRRQRSIECVAQTGMVEVPETYRTFAGSTRSAAAMSWLRSDARVRASACSTTLRASVTSASGQVLRAATDAVSGGLVGLGLPASRDHLVVVLTLSSSRSTLPAESPDLTLTFTGWADLFT